MEDSTVPNVVTTLRNTERNFTFCVTAYRKLSETEMYSALKVWMRQNKLKHIPRDRKVNYIMTLGLDG